MSENFVDLRYSKDGGYTWSDWKTRSIGDTGDFDKRAVWRRLGISRKWIVHIRMTLAADLLAGSIHAEEGGP